MFEFVTNLGDLLIPWMINVIPGVGSRFCPFCFPSIFILLSSSSGRAFILIMARFWNLPRVLKLSMMHFRFTTIHNMVPKNYQFPELFVSSYKLGRFQSLSLFVPHSQEGTKTLIFWNHQKLNWAWQESKSEISLSRLPFPHLTTWRGQEGPGEKSGSGRGGCTQCQSSGLCFQKPEICSWVCFRLKTYFFFINFRYFHQSQVTVFTMQMQMIPASQWLHIWRRAWRWVGWRMAKPEWRRWRLQWQW